MYWNTKTWLIIHKTFKISSNERSKHANTLTYLTKKTWKYTLTKFSYHSYYFAASVNMMLIFFPMTQVTPLASLLQASQQLPLPHENEARQWLQRRSRISMQHKMPSGKKQMPRQMPHPVNSSCRMPTWQTGHMAPMTTTWAAGAHGCVAHGCCSTTATFTTPGAIEPGALYGGGDS